MKKFIPILFLLFSLNTYSQDVSVETLITIGAVVVTVVGMWYSLQADIQLAKELPEPPVSRTEYDLKDQLIRETIINTQEKVEENGKKLEAHLKSSDYSFIEETSNNAYQDFLR